MTTHRIYVACLASYNNGMLYGEWIEASTDIDAMQAEINRILRGSKFPTVTVPDYEATARACGWTSNGTAFVIPGDTDAMAYALPPDWRGLVDEMGLSPIMVPSAEEWAIYAQEGLGGDLPKHAGLVDVARRVAVVDLSEDRETN